ncbi:MAG: hypothetical protein O3A46_04260, partial [Candidatus Poribacteria bacterium]|nr:hypothetical protein [Candidatus Poribacteria bacterium]
MKTMRDVLLGYLTWVQSPSKSMSVAGFLVTNHRGIPIEFRYTDPVQTNSTQELLYGEQNIDEAISVTMAASLWKSLEQKPRVLLVEDTAAGRLWEHLATKEKTLVVCMEVPPAGVYLPTHHGGALVPLDMDATRSARIQVFPDAAAALEHAEDLLTHIAQKMRLDEPFERVEAILKRLHELPENERRYRSASFEAAETPKTSSRQAPSRLEQPRRT